jgi:hypothetical protein
MKAKLAVAVSVWLGVAILAVLAVLILLSDRGSGTAIAGLDQQGHAVENGQPFYSCWRGDRQLSWDDCSREFCDSGLWKLGDHPIPEVCK